METTEEITPQAENRPPFFEKEIPLRNCGSIKLPTLHVYKMSLYHGSHMGGIKVFEEGDQQTIGRGIYFTLTKESAKGYARKRSNSAATPTVYEVEVTNADIVDLRTRDAQEQFAKLYRQVLLDWEQNVLPNLKGSSEDVIKIIKEQRKESIAELVKKIDSNSWIKLRDLTFSWADLVSTTLASEGYKGLISIEGEPPKIDFHDSVVIFNPQDIKIINQQTA